MSDDFNKHLVDCLPKLRVHALALTKNPASADDLVQDAVANALAGRKGFIPGTNFTAWMHRIVHNKFISDKRRYKETTDIDDVSESSLSIASSQELRLEIRELAAALDCLPDEQRATLVMVFVNEMSYEQVAEVTQCSLGTVKSRVFRARQALQQILVGDGEKNTPLKKTNKYVKSDQQYLHR